MSKISYLNVKIIKLTFRFRFILAKSCKRIPPLAKIVDKIFFEGDDIQVIPRDNSIKPNNSFVEEIKVNNDIKIPENIIIPSQVLKKIIKRSKYLFIMDFCICRISNKCKDYPQELGCLFLGKGSKKISNNMGRVVTAEEAIEHLNKCNEAGLVNIIGRNKIDSVWLNTGPKEELLSICSCCPCCCLWKMTPNFPKEFGNKFTKMTGVNISLNKDICIGCGDCTNEICFLDAINLDNGKVSIDKIKCRVCGRCAEVCKQDAIKVQIGDNAVERSINRIEPLVNIKQE